ncbi:MAG: hypothetical protein AB1461_02700 [Thermodesulfobacteriota bacterium]
MLAKIKPSVSRKTLLLAGALFWSLVGLFLLVRGGRILAEGDHYVMLTAALAVGTAKGLLVFEKSARKNISRILLRGDSSCLGGVFSFKAWGVILVMIFLGRFLRTSHLAHHIYAFVITAVGWGLLVASRVIWQAWVRKA